MEFKTDEANLRADSNQTGEMDLYDELVAFSNLSPEKQSTEPAPHFIKDTEPASHSVDNLSFELSREPTPEMRGEFPSRRMQADESKQDDDDDFDLAYLLRVTGPLVAPGMRVTAASSLLVCRDCRSQSSSEDMFCVVCGGLLGEVEVTEAPDAAGKAAAAKLACDDCNYLIEEDEIFCPSCGAVI